MAKTQFFVFVCTQCTCSCLCHCICFLLIRPRPGPKKTRGCPKKYANRMLLEPWCTGTTWAWKVFFCSFLTKTKQDQVPLSHVHGKIKPRQHSIFVMIFFCQYIFLGQPVQVTEKVCTSAQRAASFRALASKGFPKSMPHLRMQFWRFVKSSRVIWPPSANSVNCFAKSSRVLDAALEAKVNANKDESKCLKPLIAVNRPVRDRWR